MEPRDDRRHGEDDETADGVATSLKVGARAYGDVVGGSPVWEKRLSRGAKLRRGAVAALAVALALAVVFGGRLFDDLTQAFAAIHLFPPAPTATMPVLTAHPPVALPASTWQEISLPPPHDAYWTFASSPSHPSTLYACGATSKRAGVGVVEGGIVLWRSYDAGYHWKRLALPEKIAPICTIEVAPDDSAQVTVLMSDASNQGACLQMSAYVSNDDGDTWHAVAIPAIDTPAGQQGLSCSLSATKQHLYYWYYYTVGLQAPRFAVFERSDDGGQTWVRADNGLAAGEYAFPTFLQGRNDDAFVADVAQVQQKWRDAGVFFTDDAGRHWHYGGVLPVPGVSEFLTSHAPGAQSASIHAPVYAILGEGPPAYVYALHVLQSTDGQHWALLPPLPVRGATPEHMGIRRVLGVLADGRILFFGVDPKRGVPPFTGDGNALERDAEQGQWLWTWDPVAGRWGSSDAKIPVSPAHGCIWCSPIGSSSDSSTQGTPPGTYMWVLDWPDSPSGDEQVYRVFVPASR